MSDEEWELATGVNYWKFNFPPPFRPRLEEGLVVKDDSIPQGFQKNETSPHKNLTELDAEGLTAWLFLFQTYFKVHSQVLKTDTSEDTDLKEKQD
jgi:hypothetical protein